MERCKVPLRLCLPHVTDLHTKALPGLNSYAYNFLFALVSMGNGLRPRPEGTLAHSDSTSGQLEDQGLWFSRFIFLILEPPRSSDK